MREYPKFLKAMPSFLGFGPKDFVIIGIALVVAILFRLPPFYPLLLAVLASFSWKFLAKRFDLLGFLLPRSSSMVIRRSK
jgi:uncharacterized membrane-anchored protein YitT (DUF2179 family)